MTLHLIACVGTLMSFCIWFLFAFVSFSPGSNIPDGRPIWSVKYAESEWIGFDYVELVAYYAYKLLA